MSIRKIIEGVLGESDYEVSIIASGAEKQNIIVKGKTMGEAIDIAVEDFMKTADDIWHEDLVVSCKLHIY